MNYWIMPCNLKVFDIIQHVNKNNIVVWKKLIRAEEGDIVYIYVGMPVQKIMYKGIVRNIKVGEELLKQHSYAKVNNFDNNTYMEIEIAKEYKDGITLKKLQELGMIMVRKQTRLYGNVLEYITNYDEQS